ncbi:symmetrical bis(5'-nucleosyl)-tetraphosphatase [Buchnera aphidicola (Formosaphis micheliae)]|uniref:symmetrical bis(5'-nucleosyl)-tetraphosphatase n=1 Tax=Buchnera aphidicola TaxID=9 RepID=UPI0031B8AF58
MSTYIVGDIHGCYLQLKLLLKKAHFNSAKDLLLCTGDIVGRGSGSLEVIRFLYSIRYNVRIVLGNHDLRLLSVYFGLIEQNKYDHFEDILKYKFSENLIQWLRTQPLLYIDKCKKIILSHAGIYFKWNINTLINYAKLAEMALSGIDYLLFLKKIQFNEITYYKENMKEYDLICFIVNTLTRMRYIDSNGNLNMTCKKIPSSVTEPLIPWFHMLYDKKYLFYSIFFGHWSSLLNFNTPCNVFALDSGCCWGNKLTMIRVEDKMFFFQPYEINN